MRRLRKAFFRICGGRETDLSQFNEVWCCHEPATLLLVLTVSNGYNGRLFTRLGTAICQVSASLSSLTQTLMASWTTRSSSVASAHSRATTKMHCEVRAHYSSPARQPAFSLPASHTPCTHTVCFDVYDQDSSGDITFEELAQVLSVSFSSPCARKKHCADAAMSCRPLQVVASGDVKADLETAGRLGAIFERLDANQDHVISWEGACACA